MKKDDSNFVKIKFILGKDGKEEEALRVAYEMAKVLQTTVRIKCLYASTEVSPESDIEEVIAKWNETHDKTKRGFKIYAAREAAVKSGRSVPAIERP